MTAETVMDSERNLAWPVPPPEGYYADDLDRMSDLPPHTQLIDGGLVFVSPQAKFHMRVLSYLERLLAEQAPDHLEVCREMTVTLGPRQRPEPDIMVVAVDADGGLDQTSYGPDGVELVVEVVSPDSVVRDRERKPQLYARAGIPHMWRVENVDDRAVLYSYELDPATGVYEIAGIHHDRFRTDRPFAIDLDLCAATRRPGVKSTED